MVARGICRPTGPVLTCLLQPSQMVFLEPQVWLGPVMQAGTGILGAFVHDQKCAWISENKKAGYMFRAACALKMKRKNNA